MHGFEAGVDLAPVYLVGHRSCARELHLRDLSGEIGAPFRRPSVRIGLLHGDEIDDYLPDGEGIKGFCLGRHSRPVNLTFGFRANLGNTSEQQERLARGSAHGTRTRKRYRLRVKKVS